MYNRKSDLILIKSSGFALPVSKMSDIFDLKNILNKNYSIAIYVNQNDRSSFLFKEKLIVFLMNSTFFESLTIIPNSVVINKENLKYYLNLKTFYCI